MAYCEIEAPDLNLGTSIPNSAVELCQKQQLHKQAINHS